MSRKPPFEVVAKEPVGLDFTPLPKDIVRFMTKVAPNEHGCWVWQKYTDDKGYGQFRYGGRIFWAHRWSYAVFRRPLIHTAKIMGSNPIRDACLLMV